MMEGWKEVKLKDVFHFYNGKAIKVKETGRYPVYGSNGLIGYSNEGKFNNSIIIGRVGAYCGAVFYEKNKFWASDNTIVVKNKADFDIEFLAYHIALINLNWFSGGSAQPLLTHGWIKPIKITVPPLPTQRKIAKILSAYDDLIENNLKRIKLLEEMAQKTYEEWFVRFKFPSYETAKFDKETGLPEGWKYEKVGNLLSKIKSTTKIKTHDILEEGNIPVIDQSREFIKGYTNNRNSILDYSEPLIVFGDHTRILKLINFPFARGADGTQILLSNNICMPQHLFYFSLLNVDLSNYHYARHFKFLKEEEIIIPTEELSNKYEKAAKRQFDTIKNLRNQNQHLKEARDILLPRLMTRMIDVDKIEMEL